MARRGIPLFSSLASLLLQPRRQLEGTGEEGRKERIYLFFLSFALARIKNAILPIPSPPPLSLPPPNLWLTN